jgi:hypothetical protein
MRPLALPPLPLPSLTPLTLTPLPPSTPPPPSPLPPPLLPPPPPPPLQGLVAELLEPAEGNQYVELTGGLLAVEDLCRAAFGQPQ